MRVVLRSAALILAAMLASAASAQAPDNSHVPLIPFDTEPFIKLKPDQNLGEVLGVTVNSKGHVVILNHPGSSTGPLFGNASTEIFEYDANGNFIRELGQGVYGLGYTHSARFDRYDNLWVVDKGTHAVVKFGPDGHVLMNLGRRDEGYDSVNLHEPVKQSEARPRDSWFGAPTDVTWDQDDNIYISDGYENSHRHDRQNAIGSPLGQRCGLSAPTPTRTPARSTTRTTAGRTGRAHLCRGPGQPAHPCL